MSSMRKIREAAPKLASRPTRSQRKKDAWASKARALALGEAMPTRSQRKKDALASKAVDAAQAAAAGKRLTRPQRMYGAAMPERWRREGLATLRRMPTAGTRSRPSWLKATPQGLSSRKRSR